MPESLDLKFLLEQPCQLPAAEASACGAKEILAKEQSQRRAAENVFSPSKHLSMHRRDGTEHCHKTLARNRGPYPYLDKVQETLLLIAMAEQNPIRKHGGIALWMLDDVAPLIQREFGIQLSRSSVAAHLGRWGIKALKPTKLPIVAQHAELQSWMRQHYYSIALQVKTENAELLWGHIQELKPGRQQAASWASGSLARCPDTLGMPPRLFTLVVANNRRQMQWKVFQAAPCADDFIDFMECLVRGSCKKIILVLESFRWQKDVSVRDWLKAHEKEIEIVASPTFSNAKDPGERRRSFLVNSESRHEKGEPMSAMPTSRSTHELAAIALPCATPPKVEDELPQQLPPAAGRPVLKIVLLTRDLAVESYIRRVADEWGSAVDLSITDNSLDTLIHIGRSTPDLFVADIADEPYQGRKLIETVQRNLEICNVKVFSVIHPSSEGEKISFNLMEKEISYRKPSQLPRLAGHIDALVLARQQSA